MLPRREGLIPATRRVAPLTTEEQTTAPTRGGFEGLKGLGAIDERAEGPLLDIAGLTVRCGGLCALREVWLAVPAHSVLAVIGPNGSGKSTLFNAVTGLVTAEAGQVRFAGQEIGGLAPHRVLDRGIARTFQNI